MWCGGNRKRHARQGHAPSSTSWKTASQHKTGSAGGKRVSPPPPHIHHTTPHHTTPHHTTPHHTYPNPPLPCPDRQLSTTQHCTTQHCTAHHITAHHNDTQHSDTLKYKAPLTSLMGNDKISSGVSLSPKIPAAGIFVGCAPNTHKHAQARSQQRGESEAPRCNTLITIIHNCAEGGASGHSSAHVNG